MPEELEGKLNMPETPLSANVGKPPISRQARVTVTPFEAGTGAEQPTVGGELPRDPIFEPGLHPLPDDGFLLGDDPAFRGRFGIPIVDRRQDLGDYEFEEKGFQSDDMF